ncbi:uncharacterized protein LOC125208439 [Salvia hispanica]|uniref:uncharacterized protein LOC125208439 n=1 Tax=Salvia hispanica TaxID=49212 RepID=UPI0020098C34|nr:uncharacterized protein LOC125208439 [Salvia hispanica]XP_047964009.1 uncharacterized protein LOC125208439 [Salvia hispanica]
MECGKAASGVKKGKKKQVKDDLDRMKQAEKKKRRLEKALATSAAIRSELEKKKLKKKEEQDRLDEESAAIAEAVALQVLLGEDSDDSSKGLLKKHEELPFWHHTNDLSIFMGAEGIPFVHCQDLSSYSNENVASTYDAHQCGHMWSLGRNSHFLDSSDLGSSFYPRYWGEEYLAAQAVTSLSIADEDEVGCLAFNRM